MRNLLLNLGAVALSLAFVNAAPADDNHRHGGRYGYSGRSYYPGYGGWNGNHNRHSSRYGHIDYVPGHMHRHGNHYHYVPGHYDYHYRGQRYEMRPTPWGWSASPWSHRRD